MFHKKNKIVLLTILSLMGSFLTTSASAVDAADTAGTEVSKATLKFKNIDQTGSTKPIDPDNPGTASDNKNPDPGDPNNTGTSSSGPLSIDYAPSFDFGVGTVSNQQITYKLSEAVYDNNETKTHKPFVQVTDRRGSGAGWALNVSISNFTNSQGSTSDSSNLRGASVTMAPKDTNGKAIGAYGTVSDAPSAITNSITLSSSSQNIINAGSKEGMGTWIQRFDPDKVTLTVPGGSAILNNAYTANITWTLSAGPAN